MFRRSFMMALLLAASGVAASAQTVKVVDTFSHAVVPNGGSDNLGQGRTGGINQRVLTVTNLTSTNLEIDSCSISNAGAGWTFITPIPPLSTTLTLLPGLAYKIEVDLLNNNPATYGSTLACQGTGGFAINLQWQLLNQAATLGVAVNGGYFANNSLFTFPATQVGTPVSQTFTITNFGIAALSLTKLDVKGPGFSSTPPFQTTLASGASTNFTATFNPTAAGSASGSISIGSNDSARNPFVINLSGSATGTTGSPQIQVTDNTSLQSVSPGSTVSFGTASAGMSLTHSFRINNPGTATLNLTSSVLNPSGAGFTFSPPQQSSIAAGGSTTFSVTFLSSTTGTYNGTVSISSNASPSPFSFNVTATIGTSPPDYSVSGPSGTVANGGTVDFPPTVVGTQSDIVLTLHNNSASSLLLGNHAVSGSSDVTFAGYSQGPINGHTSVTMAVLAFVPTTAGPLAPTAATFVIGGDSFQVHFTGTGLPPVPNQVLTWNADGSNIANGGTYSFAPTSPGVPVSQAFNLTNAGAAPLTVDNLVLTNTSGSGFSLIVTPTSPIAGGATSPGRIRLLSSTPGFFAATLAFTSNDPDTPAFSFNVQGTVQSAAPTFTVTAGDGTQIANGGGYTFPNVAAGTPESRAFTVTNTGSTSMTIANPTSFVASSGQFSDIADFSPVTVAAGGTSVGRIRLLSGTAGSYTGTVTIDGGTAGVFSFTLHGTVQ